MSDSYITIPYDVYGRKRALSAYILNPVREPICQIHGITQFDIVGHFNDISEIQFVVERYTTNLSTNESQETEAYKYIRAFCQIHVPELGKKGYFIVHEDPAVAIESTQKETKTFTAKSYESILEYESLVNFSINCGTPGSKEMFEKNLDSIGAPKEKIRLYYPNRKELSLMDLVLADDYYGWSVGHVDDSLKNLERSFEIDNQSVYSFLRSDLSQAFRCIVDFDTQNKRINLYDVETVGKDTNVYLAIDHYLQEIQITQDADDIYTVFNVQGADELGIELVNFGSQKLINIDYPLSLVSQELFDKYKNYEAFRESARVKYSNLNKNHGDVLIKMNSLMDRQPVDAVNNNWSSTVYYSLDDLRVTLEAYKEVVNSIELLYKDGPDEPVNMELLNMSSDAALYHSYKDVCIPDIKAEIKRRESGNIEDATTVEQEFVWELYGISDLSAEAKKIEENMAALKKQGYNQAYSSQTKYLDRDEFNAHHERYLLLKKKLAECKAIIDKKQKQYDDFQTVLNQIETDMRVVAKEASLEGHLGTDDVDSEAAFPLQVETDTDENVKLERDAANYVWFTAKEIAMIKELYRESDYVNSNYVVTEYDDDISKTVIQGQLVEAAQKQLEKESRPQYVWSVTSDDLFSMKEFNPLKETLQLGDFVWLGRNSAAKPHWNVPKQKFRVVQINFSGLKTDNQFEFTFSTMYETRNTRNDFESLLNQAVSSSVNSMSVGVTSAARGVATQVTNSLIKPYIEAMNAKIDNLEAQNIQVADLKATSALIEALTVYDLMAGNITVDKSIVLAAREGYGSVILDNTQLRFVDANGTDRVKIGRNTGSGSYMVNIYDENGHLQWGSDGLNWAGISEGVDPDGRPYWNAEQVELVGQRLPDAWNDLVAEVSSVEIMPSEQFFIVDSGSVTPSSITATPILHIITGLENIYWYYRTPDTHLWTALTNTTPSSVSMSVDNETKAVTIPSGCSVFTAVNNSVVLKAAYVKNGSELYSDVMTFFKLTNGDGGGGSGGSSYSVILSNEAQVVAVNDGGQPVESGSYSCDVLVYYGITPYSPTGSSSPGSGYYHLSGSCSISGVTVDTSTTLGTAVISIPSTATLPQSFAVTLSIVTSDITITKIISFSTVRDGVSVTSLVTQYYLSTSDTTQTGGSWGATPAPYAPGSYYWRRDMIEWSNGETTYTTPVLDNGLNSANQNAVTAITTANGKNKVIHANKPTTWPTEGYTNGDTWFATDEGYKMYTYQNGSWTAEPLDSDAIAVGAIKASQIDAGAVTAAKIATDAVTADKVAAGAITAENLAVGDFTNYATVNQYTGLMNNTEGRETVVYSYTGTSGDTITVYRKKTETQQYLPVAVGLVNNPFQTGDQVYYDITLRVTSDNARDVDLMVSCYDSSKTFITGHGATLALTASYQRFTGSINISNSSFDTAPYVFFYINDKTSTKKQILVRSARIYRKTVGNLIVDGTISASQINGGTLTVGGANNANGQINVLDASDNSVGTWNNNGLTGAKRLETADGNRTNIILSGGAISSDNDGTEQGHIRIGPSSIVSVRSDGTWDAQIKQAYFSGTSFDGQSISGRGWYIMPFLFARRIFTQGGEVATYDELVGKIYDLADDCADTYLKKTFHEITNWNTDYDYVPAKFLKSYQATNSPESGAAHFIGLELSFSSNHRIQLAMRTNTTTVAAPLYIRHNNGSWLGWAKIATTAV